MNTNKTYIIAEAGVNHNGSLDLAYQLIDVAVASKADAVKFQTFRADHLVTKAAAKAEYQKNLGPNGETQYEMLKRLELSYAYHHELKRYAESKRIDFLSTAFDPVSLDFLVNELDLAYLKIPSGELTNAPLVLAHAQSQKDLIVSTGMSSLEEIEEALGVIAFGFLGAENPCREAFVEAYRSTEGRMLLQAKVSLLHCTSEYPAPLAEIHLRAMDHMRENFNLRIGYSDHSEGIIVPIAAVARGASIIEKHFTVNKNLPGPDHQASIEPDQLEQMVSAIRAVEKSLGVATKRVQNSEMKNSAIVRKSLVARCAIKAGELLTEENMVVLRPAGGISPLRYWELLNKPSVLTLNEGDYISE